MGRAGRAPVSASAADALTPDLVELPGFLAAVSSVFGAPDRGAQRLVGFWQARRPGGPPAARHRRFWTVPPAAELIAGLLRATGTAICLIMTVFLIAWLAHLPAGLAGQGIAVAAGCVVAAGLPLAGLAGSARSRRRGAQARRRGRSLRRWPAWLLAANALAGFVSGAGFLADYGERTSFPPLHHIALAGVLAYAAVAYALLTIWLNPLPVIPGLIRLYSSGFFQPIEEIPGEGTGDGRVR